MSKLEAFEVKCTFDFLSLTAPDQMSGKYQVLIGGLSDEAVAHMNSLRPGSLPNQAGKNQIRIRTAPDKPPYVQDESGNDLIEYKNGEVVVNTPVFSGSEGYCRIYPHMSEKWGKVSFLLNAVVVTKLAERKESPLEDRAL